MSKFARHVTFAGVIAVLSACGGGSSAPAPMLEPVKPDPIEKVNLVVSGTAATGKAMGGVVLHAKCQVGAASAATAEDGTYKMAIPDGKLPCILQITNPADGSVLHTIVAGEGSQAVANITPLTSMISARVLGGAAGAVFANFDAALLSKSVTAAALAHAHTDVSSVLEKTLYLGFLKDFIGSPLRAASPADMRAGDEHDKALDQLSARFNQDQLHLINSALTGKQTMTEMKKLIESMKTLPDAVAGPEQRVAIGTTVVLDASASVGPVAGKLSYAWKIMTKPLASAAQLRNADTAHATLQVDRPGRYMVSVGVSDGSGVSVSYAYTDVIVAQDVPFLTTPDLLPPAGPNLSSQEYWKIEYAGTNSGYCDVFSVSRYGSSYTPGLCTSRDKLMGDFFLSGRVENDGKVTLNMRINPQAPDSTQVAAIFYGVLKADGTGGGTWGIANSAAQGSWTATRYAAEERQVSPTLSNPEAGSIAASKDAMAGIWRRPTQQVFPEFALVLPNGETAWQVSASPSPDSGSAHVFGGFVRNANAWVLNADGKMYGSKSIDQVQASGTIVPGERIVGTLSVAGGKPITLSFDSYAVDNALALSLEDISGTYVGAGATYISPSGAISGTTERGCKLRGSIDAAIPGSKANLFRLKLTFYGPSWNPSLCNETDIGPDFDGYAYISASGTSRYMNTILRPSLLPVGFRSDKFMYIGYNLGTKIR